MTLRPNIRCTIGMYSYKLGKHYIFGINLLGYILWVSSLKKISPNLIKESRLDDDDCWLIVDNGNHAS